MSDDRMLATTEESLTSLLSKVVINADNRYFSKSDGERIVDERDQLRADVDYIALMLGIDLNEE